MPENAEKLEPFDLASAEVEPEAPEPNQSSPEDAAARNFMVDMANMQVIAQSLETTKVALALRQLTPPEQTERHALFERIISGAGTPLINLSAPAWKIEAKADPLSGSN